MTEEFRAAFQRVLDTAASQAPGFPEAVHDVFRLSSQVPREELAIALEALTPVLSDCEPHAGVAADLSVLAGALVESGAPAGQVGLEVLRQLGSYGQAAVAFIHAWEKTGGGALPAPNGVDEAEEKRVEQVLGDNAPLATVGWWTSLRYGLAAKAMLGDSGVRSAVRADPGALHELSQIVQALSTRLSEFGEVGELLRMSEADRLLVLDRVSRRGFRVAFDGVSDNFQLHTLLADALIGKEGNRLPGTRPDPRWVAASVDASVDPLADVVRGEWDLVGGDGTWVGNEACPGDVPQVDGERVLVLEPQSLLHSWRAGRRHPHITGSLSVLEELSPDEATAWWARTHPAGAVRHPQAPPIENDDTGAHRRPPRHFGVAAHFAEVDSGPMSAPFASLGPDLDLDAPGGGLSASFEDVTINPGAAPVFPDSPASLFDTPAPTPGALDDDEDEPDDFTVPAAWSGALTPTAPDPDDDPLVPPLPEPEWRDPRPLPGPEPEPRADDRLTEDPPAAGRPPGARLLPPMPPGVSDSSTWAPQWKWPMGPPGR
ncbi:hypothetical protein [Nocardiopsis sp. L17-MgMaSL7]|uniref:hypothetical protein n=1 Tax=Nocardiopsis sp. L17-MgMaSL7 TaxID=1938893 RepID=UPI000D71BD5D|nr:hypothetical protein [Nocardiopsis sp. L17-MgMaSL7]PWV44714.1 hypothetical protein BDW27_12262 [Nocardiopsis sp. L17-MgMaSL7]